METIHRYFVQFMLENGVSTVDRATKYCSHLSEGKIGNLVALKTLILEINREISKQYYKIVINTCEVTNQECVLWLNTKSDEISLLQISYNKLELEYFHAIMQEILHSEEHRITFIVCINITSTLTASFSRDNGQKVLDRWLKSGYYVRKGDHIYLGPRLVLEFTSYLKTNHPDSVCNLCSELVFVGKVCSSCYKILHSYCLSRYLDNQHTCPCCHKPWMAAVPDDEGREVSDVTYLTCDTGESMEIDEPDACSQNARRRATRAHSRDRDEEDIHRAGPSTRKRH